MRKSIYCILLLSLFFPLLLAWGCAYTLRYTILTSVPAGKSVEEDGVTYHLERDGEDTERTAIGTIVEESLSSLGWITAPREKASHIVTLDTETEEYKMYDERLFAQMFLRIGMYPGNRPSMRGEKYYIHNIEISIFSNHGGQQSYWTCDIRTKPVRQDLITLGRHIIPTALRHYPKEGRWELQENVHLHIKGGSGL
jgi:hypothetical protein